MLPSLREASSGPAIKAASASCSRFVRRHPLGVLAALERIDLPAAVAVIGLDQVEALDAEVVADHRCTGRAGARFLVGELEIAGEDRAAFEADALDRLERGGAATRFKVLGDKALRVLRG